MVWKKKDQNCFGKVHKNATTSTTTAPTTPLQTKLSHIAVRTIPRDRLAMTTAQHVTVTICPTYVGLIPHYLRQNTVQETMWKPLGKPHVKCCAIRGKCYFDDMCFSMVSERAPSLQKESFGELW
ncbi:uncharacterized protein KLLA0_E20087g [Kluyveromyces lactis]|uniref:KLLA0E20087p n=1 Tax=Kluyveromyces lactis (strain ATCC 8585 / CBS 2359 / DSM 70799 / NBRC 1267 / NRRL Y-1140 / WM37) TaxID=284590 RepID=Q6CMH9_KLULA|nr:uncharacterized protein KLLA0_E20087g [Kluyveromyces lactis]CAG99947.1 KLLA0E20087p [Kluyveromyces lactis]|eukprot:XP_454860.1 uncharacterized protein KLLA0_E20087g [Kluyveromyces lactis]